MKNSLCVPKKALADAAEDGAPLEPAAGDPVTVTLEATVDRIEGDEVYLRPVSVNGTPVSDASGKEAKPEGDEPSLEEEGDALRRELEGMARK